jgi:hypothetical protein
VPYTLLLAYIIFASSLHHLSTFALSQHRRTGGNVVIPIGIPVVPLDPTIYPHSCWRRIINLNLTHARARLIPVTAMRQLKINRRAIILNDEINRHITLKIVGVLLPPADLRGAPDQIVADVWVLDGKVRVWDDSGGGGQQANLAPVRIYGEASLCLVDLRVGDDPVESVFDVDGAARDGGVSGGAHHVPDVHQLHGHDAWGSLGRREPCLVGFPDFGVGGAVGRDFSGKFRVASRAGAELAAFEGELFVLLRGFYRSVDFAAGCQTAVLDAEVCAEVGIEGSVGIVAPGVLTKH